VWSPQEAFAAAGKASAMPTTSAKSAGREEEQGVGFDLFTPSGPRRREGKRFLYHSYPPRDGNASIVGQAIQEAVARQGTTPTDGFDHSPTQTEQETLAFAARDG
jgi:hypothetical protein